jgi:Flp pilus assembly protein TadG
LSGYADEFNLKGAAMIRLRKALSDQQGSVAMIFALMIFVLCGTLALGLDYARALALRTKLQSAVDAAALATNSNGTANDSVTTALVQNQFDFNMRDQKYGGVSLNVSSTPIPQGIRVTATAEVPTTFARIMGVKKMPVSVKAEAISSVVNYEIALVLDNTFSMVGGPLNDLKTAAKTLVDNVVATSTSGGVKFALVPFSNYVNVGVSNRSATWMSVPKDYTETGNYCYATTDWDGCPTTTTTGTCMNDGVPYSCGYTTCTTPGPSRQICSNWSYTHTWNGCAGSRMAAPDLNVVANFASPAPGIMDVGCPSTLQRLTTDANLVKNQIDGMLAQGETYIASGLMWGWRALSPTEPFSDAASYKSVPSTRKVMILMTDGANTKSQVDNNHEGGDVNAADTATSGLCDRIKATNIEVYTIAFNVNDAQAKKRLQACATDSSHFFDSASGAALQQAFSQIGSSLVKLQLSR